MLSDSATQFRSGGDPLGLHRVRSPVGLLPQAADVLDNSLPPYASEVWLNVDVLNIDAASFVQLEQVLANGGPAIAAQIEAIVSARGKMQNPVTGSGGMLLGRLHALGPQYCGPLQGLPTDTVVATLVSLTLTPLWLQCITQVVPHAHQVHVRGHALLPSSAPVAVVPTDYAQTLALAILDVCGAPALVQRWAQHLPIGGDLVVLGAGKAGALSLAAARNCRPDLRLWAIDRSALAVQQVHAAGLCDGFAALDAADALAVRGQVHQWTSGRGADAVVNMASVAGTEMATILACKSRGMCLFFGMATAFSRVALGAEGVGADVDLLIGNGYAEGHAAFALELVRQMPAVRALLQLRLAGS
ncbi:MAG: L-erythro-3,5-diaminohexanoate dehydrogenase [Myxococcales bacterium]|nr:L-erythro-3,5-diaminohexanoate dehydrogenase [Myxococcales bacterium]